MIDVVSAVIIRAGRVLLTQRRPEKDFPFAWECPGGKVDGAETPRIALSRELLEEIGVCDVGIPSDVPIWSGEFQNMVQRSERAHVRVSFYRVTLSSSRAPRPCEGQGIGWFTASEMLGLELAPANAKACGRIVELLAQGAR